MRKWRIDIATNRDEERMAFTCVGKELNLPTNEWMKWKPLQRSHYSDKIIHDRETK